MHSIQIHIFIKWNLVIHLPKCRLNSASTGVSFFLRPHQYQCLLPFNCTSYFQFRHQFRQTFLRFCTSYFQTFFLPFHSGTNLFTSAIKKKSGGGKGSAERSLYTSSARRTSMNSSQTTCICSLKRRPAADISPIKKARCTPCQYASERSPSPSRKA